MSDERSTFDNCHCWHTVGVVKNSHGKYVPSHVCGESAMRCCFCGQCEPVNSRRVITLDQIIFNADYNPTIT